MKELLDNVEKTMQLFVCVSSPPAEQRPPQVICSKSSSAKLLPKNVS